MTRAHLWPSMPRMTSSQHTMCRMSVLPKKSTSPSQWDLAAHSIPQPAQTSNLENFAPKDTSLNKRASLTKAPGCCPTRNSTRSGLQCSNNYRSLMLTTRRGLNKARNSPWFANWMTASPLKARMWKLLSRPRQPEQGIGSCPPGNWWVGRRAQDRETSLH